MFAKKVIGLIIASMISGNFSTEVVILNTKVQNVYDRYLKEIEKERKKNNESTYDDSEDYDEIITPPVSTTPEAITFDPYLVSVEAITHIYEYEPPSHSSTTPPQMVVEQNLQVIYTIQFDMNIEERNVVSELWVNDKLVNTRDDTGEYWGGRAFMYWEFDDLEEENTIVLKIEDFGEYEFIIGREENKKIVLVEQ